VADEFGAVDAEGGAPNAGGNEAGGDAEERSLSRVNINSSVVSPREICGGLDVHTSVQ